jgi:hypothetical protein
VKSYVDHVNQQAELFAGYGHAGEKRSDGGADITMKHTNIQGSEMETDAERADRVGLSSLRMTDDISKAVQQTDDRVSLDSIIAKIAHVDYEYPTRHPHMTLCICTMKNGFIFIGKAVPADPKNHNKEVGMKFAYEDAVRQMWPMEAYLLRDKMAAKEPPA